MKPFYSVIIVIFTLFAIVFLQMEERRLGYSLLKLNREYKETVENKRKKTIQLTKLTRPQLVEDIAQSRMTLKKIDKNQIIHLTETDLKQVKEQNKEPM